MSIRIANFLLKAFAALLVSAASVLAAEKPNIVIIFLDDAGYADFHPFGNPPYTTPHVEQLAKEGTHFTQFYVPQAICSASRGALMTGCYPGRTKLFGAHGPGGAGLSRDYATMGDVLKRAGYATAMFGKWHCGDKETSRPLARGFDENEGLMYSNDMWRFHPMNPKHWGKKPLQYWKAGKVHIADVSKADQRNLTTWYTEAAVDFIARKKDKPFFLYLAHSMPHVPLFVSDKFAGKSGAGLYGDVMQEIDWSVGQVNKALRAAGVERNTIIIFTSDNGPWAGYGTHAGKTPYREAKATSFDGGTRSALVVKYPAAVSAGAVSGQAFCSIDFMPTLARQAEAALPDNTIDGKDVWDIIVGKPGAENPHDFYYFSTGRKFEAVMTSDGRWKLHTPHHYRHVEKAGTNGFDAKYARSHIDTSLFDLVADPFETKNVLAEHPDVGAKLKSAYLAHATKFYGKP
jgi:arylsulfatase A